MLLIEVHDDDCSEGEAFHYEVPLDTPWSDIQTMVRMVHPTCHQCSISVMADE